MKKFFVCLFLTLSVFIVASCFIGKTKNKNPLGFQTILLEIKESKIGFDFNNDINELATNLNNLNFNTSFKNGDILGVLTNIGKTIYYGVKFLISMVIHTLVATLNVMILIGRCIGLTDLSYIRLTSSSGGSMNDAIPSVFPGGTGGLPNPFA